LSFTDINLQEKNYLIFENDWAEGINKMSNKVWEDFGYSKSFYTKTFPQEQIQIASFYTEPENSLSDFKLSHIITSIESLLYQSSNPNTTISDENVRCNLVIEAIFKRPLPNEAKTVTKKSELVICDSKDINSTGCKGLNQTYILFNNSDSHYLVNNVTINISGFSPIVRLTASSEPKSIELEKQIIKDLILKPIYKNRAYLFEIYFENIKDGIGLQYHLFNDKVSSSTLGYSILGFYSAFILVIGTYVTNIFNYNPERIIIGEMPHPEKLLNLCECVKISRYTYDFKKEEYLYSILIEIMRTPDFIKKLTQSTVEQFQRRMSLPS
jgi:spore germination protein YaaH